MNGKKYFEETEKAVRNFPLNCCMPPDDFVISLFEVKLAALRVNRKLGYLDEQVFKAMEKVILRGVKGEFCPFFKVTMLQGGAGTSLNMTANEIIAKFASETGKSEISPYLHSNLHQSTNDVIPTAIRITLIKMGIRLEKALNNLLVRLEEKEKEFDNLVKPGTTQMQYAVPTTLGREFSAYSSAISRDRWRVYKIIERLKEVNLGGTAIGTGFNAPKRYIFSVVEELRKITGLPLARAENLMDATQNADVYLEVGGILSACAANLAKISSDLRFLSSSEVGQIILKEVQKGSSIMPGKVNPVIPEFVQNCAFRVFANINSLQFSVSSGHLELNPFVPFIGYCLFESFDILEKACLKLSECVRDLKANEEKFKQLKYNDYVVLYALSTLIGYEKAEKIFIKAQKEGAKVMDFAVKNGVIEREALENALLPENLLKLGF